MSMRVFASRNSHTAAAAKNHDLTRRLALPSFEDDFTRYQGAKRCRPVRDLGAGLAGGAGSGAAGGLLVGAAVLGFPLLPIGIGIFTGILGGIAGAALGGIMGATVGGVSGGVTAASHAHLHAPERTKLRKHVFREFGVVGWRHQSARIMHHLKEGKVLGEGRVVQHPERIDHALRNLRVYNQSLTPVQLEAIKRIVFLQASHA